MHPIHISKELVNDDAYLVAALLAQPGDAVVKGQALAELETSKAATTLVSPADGVFRPEYAEGQMVPVGAVFGHIAEDAAAFIPEPAPCRDAPQDDTPDPRFSRAAWGLFWTSGVPIEQFAGMAHIRRSDVEKALAMPSLPRLDRSALIFLGGGGHCRECIEAVELAGKYRISGIIDTYARPGSLIAGHPVLGDNAILDSLRSHGIRHLVLAYAMSGNHADRGRHFRELTALGHNFPAVIHPNASVHTQAALGAGVHIMAGAVVGSEAVVGDACIVNSNAVVSHDCRLGSNVHVAPGALLAGGVTVENDTVIGMGATVYMRTKIGAGVVLYNGAQVTADVPDCTVVKDRWPARD